jgi:predicted MPP superfamily phosphohydrolase
MSRRAFFCTIGGAVASLTCAGAYATQVEPFWLDVHDNDVPLPSWPAALDGLRIAHVTDVHFDRKLPRSYTDEVARRLREEVKPDLVAFSGDLTTHAPAHLEDGAKWLASFGLPTFACLGNHDYDPTGSARAGCRMDMADRLDRLLEGSGVVLLRNQNYKLSLSGGRELYIVGVEDFYTGALAVEKAVEGIPEGAARLMLCHNPDASRLVDAATAGGLILSGHTHGGQIRIPGYGHLVTNIMDETKIMGQFSLGRSTLYVSRGIGYLLQARLFCRPELPVHKVHVKK